MQQGIKIIEAYFATKSVLLTQLKCRRDFGRNNVPDRKTIQRLMAKFRETGSVADAPPRKKIVNKRCYRIVYVSPSRGGTGGSPSTTQKIGLPPTPDLLI